MLKKLYIIGKVAICCQTGDKQCNNGPAIPMKLIIGGTGTLGSALTRRLLAHGEPVRVMTRKPAKAAELAMAGAEVVVGDLSDRASVEDACRGADAVVAAAHSLFGRGQHSSASVDGQRHKVLIDLAKASGVKHFIYTSIYTIDPVYQRVPFFRIKQEVEEYLKASGLPYTILRPSAFMESHAHELIGKPIIKKERVIMIGRGLQPRNFVAADDVARVAMIALSDQSLLGQTVAIGGPGNYTNMDVVRLYEHYTGHQAKVTHLPPAVSRALSLMMRPFHPGFSQVLKIATLSDKAGQSFDVQSLLEKIPIRLTSLEEWVENKLASSTGSASTPETAYSLP